MSDNRQQFRESIMLHPSPIPSLPDACHSQLHKNHLIGKLKHQSTSYPHILLDV